MLGVFIVFLGAFCAVSSGLQGDPKLDAEIDGYLPWYRTKVQQKIPLDDIIYSWTKGYVFWKRGLTLKCSGGLVDLSSVKLERAGSAASSIINSTRPWVIAPLAFDSDLRYAFYECRLDDTKNPNGTQRGSLVGGLRLNQPLDFVYSYKDRAWWCEVNTIRLTMRETSIELGMDTELLTEASDDDVMKIKALIVASIEKSTQAAWNVVGQGPKCDSSHCKT